MRIHCVINPIRANKMWAFMASKSMTKKTSKTTRTKEIRKRKENSHSKQALSTPPNLLNITTNKKTKMKTKQMSLWIKTLTDSGKYNFRTRLSSHLRTKNPPNLKSRSNS